MAKKLTSNPDPSPVNKLVKPREEVHSRIQTQIDKGLNLRNQEINSSGALKDLENEVQKWRDYTFELLKTLFTSPGEANRFASSQRGGYVIGATLREEIRDVKEYDIGSRLTILESLQGRLELIDEVAEIAASVVDETYPRNEVFIVHGHDDALKHQVARLINQIGLNPIILDEQPGAGLTIIEKFETHSARAGFAVVLFTPDDVGSSKIDKDNPKSRTRQNVIFELGYFYGKLGRGKVAILHHADAEIPSDLQGIVYISVNGNWERKLILEVVEAGLPADTQKYFGSR